MKEASEAKEEKVYFIDPGDVIVEERLRKSFDKKAMDELCASIRDKGQLQASICRVEGERVILVAGERRRQACEIIGCNLKYTLEDETDPIRLLEIEMDENNCRLDFTWQEKVNATQERHAKLQEIKGTGKQGSRKGHSIKDTAKFQSESITNVRDDLEVAQYMDIPEVARAKSKTEAKKTIKRLKENFVRHKALEEAQKEEQPVASSKANEDSDPQAMLKSRITFYKDRIIRGDMLEVLEKLKETFDVVLFDPPWAVDYDKHKNVSKDNYEDSIEAIVPQMESWLRMIYSKMSEHSHLYMFFGITNYDLVYNLLEKVGFSTNRMPITWIKQGAHRTQNPDMWPGRACEPIAFARKGEKFLIRKGAPDYIITPVPGKTIQQTQKSAKHPDVWLDLLKRSTLPGDNILDPMCGSGMAGVACEVLRPTHSLNWTMIEQRTMARDLALANVVRGYSDLITKATKEPKGEENE